MSDLPTTSVEDHLARHPELAANPEAVLDLIYAELLARGQHGERPPLEEYLRRFPQHEAPLRRLFEVHAALGPGALPSTRSTEPPSPPAAPDTQADTLPGPGGPRPGAEPVPGYRLVRRLGRGGFGEVWEAEAPGGFRVAFKFVGLTGRAGEFELRSLEIMKNLRHPNLLTIFGTWQNDGVLLIGMELADRTLSERLEEALGQSQQGIPRRELLRYTQEAAKAIDYLNKARHFLGGTRPVGIQHGDIKPQNLLLVGNGLKVGDFGLLRLLEGSVASHTGGLTPGYAAPEVIDGQISNWSDQYSLAITWCQLRGGRLPVSSVSPAAADPDLSMLPEEERAAVARALARQPRQRWPNCRAFVKALAESKRPQQQREGAAEVSLPSGWEQEAKIGEGGFGEVWRARAPGGIPCAIKIIHRPLEEKEAQREREALEVMRALRHDHLLKTQAYWALEDRLIIAMDLADKSLRQRLAECQAQGRCIPPDELIGYMGQTAGALDYLHEKKVVHGDIKPENILLMGKSVKLADFGLAFLMSGRGLVEANPSGTPAYMAPEVFRGKASALSDQYGLACAYAELRGGVRPFIAGDLAAMMSAHFEQPPALDKVPEAEQRVLRKALAKKPDERYPSCYEFVLELRVALGAEAPLSRWVAGGRTRSAGGRNDTSRAPAVDDSDTDRVNTIQSPGDSTDWQTGHEVELSAPPAGRAWHTQPDTRTGRLEAPAPRSRIGLLLIVWLVLAAAVVGACLTRPWWTLSRTSADSSLYSLAVYGLLALGGLLVVAVVWWCLKMLTATLGKPDAAHEFSLGTETSATTPQPHIEQEESLPESTQDRAVATPSYPTAPSGVAEVRALEGHTDSVWSAAFSPDGRHVLSGSMDATLRLWDAATAQELRRFTGHGDGVTSVALSRDGRFALSASLDGSVRLWDVPTGQQLRQFTGHAGRVFGVASAPDGRHAASGGEDNTVCLWDVTTGREVRRLKGHAAWVTSVAFSADGAHLLSGSEDGTVRVWAAASGREVHRLEGHTAPVTSVAFAPDGRRALSGGRDRAVLVWDVQRGQQVRRWTGHTDWVRSVAFSPDGRLALSGGDDELAWLWDPENGAAVRRFDGHTWSILCVAFSPDGRHVLSAGDGQAIHLWPLANGS